MAFFETPVFPDIVADMLIGGEEFVTSVVIAPSGREQRNSLRTAPRRRYRVSQGLQVVGAAIATAGHFRLVGGRANGFRVRVPWDYQADHTTGILGTGVSTGVASYQLARTYGVTGVVANVLKPVVTGLEIKNNGAVVPQGGGAGQWSIDATTGIVTFVTPFPTTGNTLTWAGQYHVPCRYDTDWLQIGLAQGLLDWQGVSLIELLS